MIHHLQLSKTVLKRAAIAVAVAIAAGILAFAYTPMSQRNTGASADLGCQTWNYQSQIHTCDELVNLASHSGAKSVLDRFSQLYVSDDKFRLGDCHIFAHSFGGALYYRGDTIPAAIFLDYPEQESFCSMKLLHGYFKEFFVDKGIATSTASQANSLCSSGAAIIATSSIANEYKVQCYLGIGFGLVASHTRTVHAIPDSLTNALAYCATMKDASSCGSGAFEGAELLYLGNVWGHGTLPQPPAPFSWCERISGQFKQSCYAVFRSFVWNLTLNIKAAVDQLHEPDPAIRTDVVRDISWGATTYYLRNQKSIDYIIGQCRTLAAADVPTCIQGVARNFTYFKSGQDAWNFCNTSDLSEREQNACKAELVDSFPTYYSGVDLEEACQLLPPDLQHACLAPRPTSGL